MCFTLLHFRMPQVEWFKSLRLVGCYLTVVIDAFLTAAAIGAQTPSQQLFGDKLKYYWNQGITWQNRVSEVNLKACLSAKREYRMLSLTLPAAVTMANCSPADPAVGLMRAYIALRSQALKSRLVSRCAWTFSPVRETTLPYHLAEYSNSQYFEKRET